MILYLGAMTAPPVVLALNLLVLVVIAGAALVVLQGLFGWSGEPATAFALLVSVLLVMGLHAIVLGIAIRIRARRPFPLERAELFIRWGHVPVGPKASTLARLATRGLPVAPALVVPVDQRSSIPRLARDVLRFAHDRNIACLIVRSAFAEEDAERPCAGVFESVPHVAVEQGAIVDALRKVAASRSSPRARALLGASLAPAAPRTSTILVQEQVPHRLWGVLSSFDPSERRLDKVYLDLFDQQGSWIGRAIYQAILGRWIERDANQLPEAAADTLLEAWRAAESLLGGPIAVEFGIVDTQAVIYQARRMPAAQLAPVWTNTGVVDLHADALPPLLADIAFGRELGFLKDTLWCNRAAAGGARIALHPPSFRWILGRPYVEYASLASTTRFAAPEMLGVHHVVSLLLRERGLQRAANEVTVRIDRDLIAARDDLRAALVTQSALEAQALVWQGWERALTQWTARQEDDPPWIPWHGLVRRRLAARALLLQRIRDKLHGRITSSLQAIANAARERSEEQCGLPRALSLFLRWEEWIAFCKTRTCPETELLDERRRSFEQASSETPDSILAPHAHESSDVLAGGELSLGVFIAGDFEGIAARAGSEALDRDHDVVILPNHSLRWLPAALAARGVILVGGGLLTHLGLQLLEAGKPTVFGLSPGEVAALDGCYVRVASGRVFAGEHVPDA